MATSFHDDEVVIDSEEEREMDFDLAPGESGSKAVATTEQSPMQLHTIVMQPFLSRR